ncbi:hypothetical protein SAMD00019534_019870 [Acytostelium subglobosum LB1]|uniref:hypothetical protein n=1 Tax=Acytostelium subglobosum LB1 TaxID=1410327 RepID=UPI0006450D39|nr:hypothetical protein SAMD00019534_019870 [Acytostelium subglobosum LB1]GAM18812.1 hypothetical protein SAMD00019534_019870 [Acytostelium subglobosum LB1]|eukprot:XP_012758032.1 hypothetical protein SAMD00019534_019870 [Acytostelium subglobosum LB1]
MVTFGGGSEKCTACEKTVYATEKIVVEDKEDKKTFHKLCLKCSHCKITLSLGNYASLNGVMFCKPHFKQLFATKGNYDEGFGKSKHSTQWAPQANPAASAPSSFIKLEETKTTEKKDTPTGISSRFSGSLDKCTVCTKTVYLTEKLIVEDKDDKKVLHKQCLKCSHCKITLSLGTYASMNGVYYCKPHFKQLFAAKGNFDEIAGNSPKTDKWAPQVVSQAGSFVPIEKTAEKEKNTNSANPDVAKRFSSANSDKCQCCSKTVYQTEKVVLEETDTRRIFHKTCLKCSHCSVILNLGTLAQLDGVLYCKPHFKQLFALKGNLDEGFGRTKRQENLFPYLEKKEDYVPSVDRIEQNTATETEYEKFQRLSQMTYVEDDVKPVFNPSATFEQEEEKPEEVVPVAAVEEETPVSPAVEEETPVAVVEEPVAVVEEPVAIVEEPVAVVEEEPAVLVKEVEEPTLVDEESSDEEEPVVEERRGEPAVEEEHNDHSSSEDEDN